MFTKEEAIALLIAKAEELGRLPKKSDFADADIARIKAKLGPWPRALETVGLKEKAAPPKRKANPNYGKSLQQKKNALKKLQIIKNQKEQ